MRVSLVLFILPFLSPGDDDFKKRVAKVRIAALTRLGKSSTSDARAT